jgi:hypothetical protein
MPKCLNCSAEFDTRGGKLFCCETCRLRFNARKAYHKNKDNPEYKIKRRAYFKRWIKKNKEKYNESVREANKKYQVKLRKYRKENNLCVYCGKSKELNKSLCLDCYTRRKNE